MGDSESDNDVGTSYGTEFPELEDPKKDGISRRPLRVEEQIVTDERGRQRFHGAFTGGFSAGYFNTVGTKEGWTPRQYKSARSNRAENESLRPEDFMDADDLGEFGIAPRRIQTTREFGKPSALAPPGATSSSTTSGDKKRRLAWEHPTDGNKDSLGHLIKPISDSFGRKLLRSMGWRTGKGIGPKVKKKLDSDSDEEEDDSTVGNVGCALPPDGYELPSTKEPEEEEVDTDDEDVIELDPDDIDPHMFKMKRDNHGIGYEGQLNTSDILSKAGVKSNSGARDGFGTIGENTARKQKGAFGVGAFEEDDDDIYTSGDMSQYDFNIGGRDNPADDQRSKIGDVEFQTAQRPQPARPFFPAPKLPRDFDGRHRPNKLEMDDSVKSILQLAKSTMNPVVRARMLGENYSVKSLIPSKSRDRFRAEREGRSRWGSKDETMKKKADEEREMKAENSQPDVKPSTSAAPDSKVTQQQLLVFPNDPKRQGRFMEFVNCTRRGYSMPQPVEMTEEEWEGERRELIDLLPESIRVFLPRRSDSSAPLARADVAAPFAHLLKSKFVHSNAGTHEDPAGKGDERMDAVKMKMFGKLTRSQLKWHPAYVLCKRFNLPNPYPDSGLEGCPALQAKKDVERMNMDNMFGESKLPSTAQEMENRRELEYRRRRRSPSPKRSSRRTSPHDRRERDDSGVKREVLSSDQNDGDESDENEKNEEIRPPTDLFKAIFSLEDNDEEDDDDGDGDDVADLNNGKQLHTSSKRPSPSSINFASDRKSSSRWDPPRSKPPPSLNTADKRPIWSSNGPKKKDGSPSSENDNVQKEAAVPLSEAMSYGPSLPPPELQYLPTGVISRHKNKKKEKKSKKKHKHEKSKRKKSKKSSKDEIVLD